MKHLGEGTAVILGLVLTAVPMGCRPTRTITKEDRAIADLKSTRMKLNKERQRVCLVNSNLRCTDSEKRKAPLLYTISSDKGKQLQWTGNLMRSGDVIGVITCSSALRR
jgi:hypothetical protein